MQYYLHIKSYELYDTTPPELDALVAFTDAQVDAVKKAARR